VDGQNHHSTWSAAEDTKLQRMWLRDGRTQVDIANELEKSKSAVTRRIATLAIRGHKGDITLYRDLQGEAENVILRPIRVDLPEREPVKFDSADFVSLHWSDVHFPFQDVRAVEILYQVADLAQPAELYCQGDIYDFWQLSRHRPPEEKSLSAEQVQLQETLEAGTKHLALMKSITGAERSVFFAGNHEDRHEKLLIDLQKDPKYRYLMRLTSVQDALTLENMAGIVDLGYEYIPYFGGSALTIHDKLVLHHGYSTTMWVTRGELARYGKSVMFGHCHRLQNYTQRNLQGVESAWTLGCLCQLDQHYTRQFNWQQGFAVVTWKKTSDGYMFNVERVRIHDGKAIWRDHTLKA
jgi:hypothetical protein